MTKASAFIPCSLVCFVGVNLLSHAAYAQTAETAPVQTLPDVNVSADAQHTTDSYQQKDLSSPRLPEKRLDTAQSITVVPEKLMKDQGVTTLRDALRDVSGLSLSAGEGGSQGDNLTLRGFSARSDIYADGMRDFGSYNRDPFVTENVEVLKGPSSALFGRGSTGGVVNQVSKTPKAKAFTDGTFALGSDNTRRATADINKPLADGVAFRLNLMDHFNNVAGRDIAENRRFGIAPSLAFGLGSPTRLTISYLHQNENNIPDYGIPYINSRPAAVDSSNFYGFKDANFFRSNVDVVTVKAEHDFGNGLVLRDQLRQANYERNFQITEAKVPATVTPATPLDTIMLGRGQLTGTSLETSVDNDLSLSAKFATGFATHKAIVGIEAIRDTSAPKRFAFTGVPDVSLQSPQKDQPFSGSSTLSSQVRASAVTMAGYLADSISLGEQWIFNAGLRWDTVAGKYRQDMGTPVKLSRTDKALSWRSGLLFKPVENSSIYLNYGTSFNPSIEGLSLAASTSELDPEKSRTYELGSKTEFMGGQLAVEGAVFRLEKTNARTPSLSDPTLNVLDGKQRVDGAELSIVGHPAPKLQISSGYTYLLAKVIETNRPAEKNQLLTNTPKHSANLWGSYAIAERWDLGAGLFAVSSRRGSTLMDASTGKFRQVKGYTTVNAMTKYRLSDDVDLQLNLSNVGDTKYIDSLHPGHLIPGVRRTAILSTEFRI